MQEQRYSPKFIRQRKFYTALPVLALPFLTLFFWALGGGRATDEVAKADTTGFNFALPDAYLSKEKDPLDKFGFYEQAEKDSARMAELMKNDPYYQGSAGSRFVPDSNKLLGMATRPTGNASALNPSTYGKPGPTPNETKVYKKLDELTAVLNASTETAESPVDGEFLRPQSEGYGSSAEIKRLESMMAAMEQQGSGGSSQDPEMQELSSMLEKVLDIQHPERVEQRLKAQSETSKGQVFAVSGRGEESPVTLLEQNGSSAAQNTQVTGTGFYSLDDAPASQGQNAIEAVVHETQELVNGSTVKLRLINDVYINGVLVPKDNFLFGKASLSGERLEIQIGSLRYGNSLFPVELAVFDMDGMSGIHIPGAITRDAAKQSGDRAIQSIGMMSMDPSIGAQAASAGIELGRNLLSRKVKLVKVTVKAGYQVLIRDEKQVASR